MNLASSSGLLPIFLLLAGCASQPDAGTATAGAKADAWNGDKSVANDANPGCHMLNRATARIRPGSNVSLHMFVVNSDRWCFSAFGLSGVDAGGSTLVNQPSNGEVRMFPRGEAVIFGYRPKAGYAGSDSFLIEMPTGLNYEINLAVTVTVEPEH